MEGAEKQRLDVALAAVAGHFSRYTSVYPGPFTLRLAVF